MSNHPESIGMPFSVRLSQLLRRLHTMLGWKRVARYDERLEMSHQGESIISSVYIHVYKDAIRLLGTTTSQRSSL